MRRVLFLVILPAAVAWGGQSLVVNAKVTNSSFPDRSKALPWRVELYLHDWPDHTPTSRVAIAQGVGFQADILGLSSGRIFLQSFSLWDGGGSVCQIDLNDISPKALYLRFQRDPATKSSYCEAWDSQGTRIHNSAHRYSFDTEYHSNGVEAGDNSPGAQRSIGFFRIHSTVVPQNARPPVTYDPGDVLLWWKFDGDLSDSSGHGYDGVADPAASITYVETPGQNRVAIPRTYGAPAWSNWTSLRAGVPQRLDASASYSQSDTSSAVTYEWQRVSGPTNPIWDDPSSATPTIRGLIFGTYTFRLRVTDVSGLSATADLTVGAVATDSNGVVVQANPAADRLFGPMIAFGRNPWGYADERALAATTLRSARYDAQGLASPSWAMPRAGTVSYDLGPRPATLAAGITATDMSIPVSDATQFDLTTFPTLILAGNIPFEEIHICSVSGNTLEVCYDGRAWRTGTYQHLPAQAWAAGTKLSQLKMTGAGTQFLSDFCPAGAGWSGAISYQEGSAGVTAGSPSVTGSGTAWSNANAAGRAIRIQGTHDGGIPFVFHAYVSSVGADTALIMNRPWPSDADSGTFRYALIDADTRNITPGYFRGDGTPGQIYFPTSACESATEIYRYLWWDALSGSVAAQPYSWMDGFGYVGDFGPNFYDEVLAHYALYFRSGWTPALDAARKIGDYWLEYPEIAQGDAGGIPRRMSITGVFASAVLDGRSQHWSGLRSLARRGIAAIREDCDQDVRENAYALSWLALAAMFDPVDTGNPADPNQRSYWRAKLADAYQRDAACKGSDDSWKSGFYWNPYIYPALTVTDGSPIARGINLPPSLCPNAVSGTGTVAAGSATVLGNGFAAGNKILITGTWSGKPYTGAFEYRLDSPLRVTLAVLWPGDTGAITWMIEGGEPRRTFATIAADNGNDPRFGQVWACHWDNSSQITLNRPWVGAGTETVHIWRDNLVGRGQQPFVLGIKTLQMRYASLGADPDTSRGYAGLANAAANWILTQGFDKVLQAVSYGRIFPQCEPPMTESGVTTLDARIPECIENSYSPGAVSVARARNAEVQNAVGVAYQANPTSENRTLGDQIYCAQWGDGLLTTPGFCGDGITASNLSDNYLGAYKYTGFFFGIGMAHQWPAVRVGGVQDPAPQAVPVIFDLESRAPAAGARITITQPSSAQTVYRCAASPCNVAIDRRQGAHWVSIEYLSNSGEVLSSAAPYLLEAP